MSIYSHMTCISNFKRVKVAHRFGKTPEEMLSLHNLRKKRNKNQQKFCSIIQFIKNRKSFYQFLKSRIQWNAHYPPWIIWFTQYDQRMSKQQNKKLGWN